MKLSCLLFGAIVAVAVIAVLLLIFGVSFHPPIAAQGAALYNPANEVMVKGTVREVTEFSCPVSEGEMGTHVLVDTGDGLQQIHLAPGRVLRSLNLRFSPGDQIQVVGSKVRIVGSNDIIAREITRGSESIIFRDHSGKLMLAQ